MKSKTVNLQAKRARLISFFIVLSIQIAKPTPNNIANSGQDEPSKKKPINCDVHRFKSLFPGGARWAVIFANKIPSSAKPLSISKTSSRLDGAMDEKLEVIIVAFDGESLPNVKKRNGF